MSEHRSRRRALVRALGAYAGVVALVSFGIESWASLGTPSKPLEIESAWRKGELVAHRIGGLTPGEKASAADAILVKERVVSEGPVLTWSEGTFALSVIPGREGVLATIGDHVEAVTPDELFSRQGYDHGFSIPALTFSFGTDVPLALALLADRFGVTVPVLREQAHFRRFRVERAIEKDGAELPPTTQKPVMPESMTASDVREAALAAARYLARGVDENGRYRYMVNAATNRTLPGYDWPRHAGATYFLAQAAALGKDPMVIDATKRAAGQLRDKAALRCGDAMCIGSRDTVDLGSAALALVAFAEVARTGIDPSYAETAKDLARFVRNQQRPDGEFMHEYDRVENHPNDVQYLYYSGEATLALARMYRLSHDPRDLDGARRALARLVGPGWSFFGDHYYFGEEHWTCQALADLWDDAPDPKAFDFCLRWQAYGRHMMHGPGETPFDADGSYGVGPLVMPRLTPAASRAEAGVATLDVARRARSTHPEVARAVSKEEETELAYQLRRSLALILRNQFRPGISYLFADPAAVDGAIPGSPVDWEIRIDYAQHAGSAMIRWLDVDGNNAAVVP